MTLTAPTNTIAITGSDPSNGEVVAAFGLSHSTMLVSSVEHWQEMFDRVDRRAPINDFDGVPRTFDELLKSPPPDAAAIIAKGAMAERTADHGRDGPA